MKGLNVNRMQTMTGAILLLVSLGVAAQKADTPQEPGASGAIIIPPDTDSEAVKPAPKNVDPEIAVPPRKEKRKPDNILKKKKSKEDDCKGRAELCGQSSPR